MVKQSKLTRKGDRCGNAAYNGSTWYHRYKELLPNGDIRYGRKEGFMTAEEANESYKIYEQIFETEARKQGLATTLDGKVTFAEYLKYFLEDVLAVKCEPSTRVVYSYTLYKKILPNLENNIEIGLINEHYLNELLQKVAPISKSAGNKAREFIYLALKNAVTESRIKDIPKMKAYPRKKGNIRLLDSDQVKIFLEGAVQTNWYLEILLGLFMGLRKAEILGLKFSDISDDQNSLTVSRQLAYEVEPVRGGYEKESAEKVEKYPKTDNSYRTLYVPQIIREELKKRREQIDHYKGIMTDSYIDGDYVCCQPNGKPRGYASLNKVISTICSNKGLPHITVHSLRHLYATILLEQGYELQLISAVLGHSSINVTYEYYVDIMDAGQEISSFMNDLYPVEGE